MAVNSQLAKAVVVATLALAPVLAGSSVAQQAGTDNPPPGVTVLQSAQAPGPAGERPATAEPFEKKTPPGETQPAKSVGQNKKKTAKYDITTIGNRRVGRGLNIYSIEREQSMGKQLASELEAQIKLVDDPMVNDYVNGLVQRLVQSSDTKVPFTVKVIDDVEVNAFGLPGGFLYVHTGLILAAENEAELAAVIAHEIAHVAARHATKNASRSFLWNIASMPMVFVGGPAGAAVRQVAGLAMPFTRLKFSRDAEREADLLGVEYAYVAGYDPVALIQIFERLRAGERDKKSMLSRAFSCHPTTGDRVQRAQKAIVTYLPPRDAYVVNTSVFDEVKARLGQLGLVGAGANAGRPVLRRRTTPAGQEEAPTTGKPN
jgi:predicted Zn-dependent protease